MNIEERKEKYGCWTGRYELRDVPAPYWAAIPFWKRLWKRITYKRQYEFITDPKNPLTFNHPDNFAIRPDNHFFTDLGSIPKIFQSLCPALFAKDLWERSYILHDSGFAFKGLFFAQYDLMRFVFSPMSKKTLNNLLSLTIKAEGGSALSSGPIWFGVWLGSGHAWDKGDLRDAGDQSPR